MSEGSRLTRYEMKRVKNEAAALPNEDRLNRLPDAILHVIFEKIFEAKCLLSCSLVFKRFASLIAHNRTITVQLPNPSHDVKVREFLTSFGHFLKQFRCIHTLYIHLSLSHTDYPFTPDPFVRWEIEMRSKNVSQFITLSAKSFTAKGGENKEDNDNSQVNAELDATEQVSFKFRTLCYELDAYQRCLRLNAALFDSRNVNVQKIVVTDSKDQGKIAILQMQDSLGVEELSMDESNSWYWYVPVLRLPTSGGVMKEVKLAIHKVGWDVLDGDFFWACDGEDGVLWEAAREIMKRTPFSLDW